jgi:hypothetical protein
MHAPARAHGPRIMREITVTLPADRTQPGTLTVTDGKGRMLASMPCLGRAARELCAQGGNPSCAPTKRLGNTPLGDYVARQGVVARPKGRTTGFGTHWIPLDPVGGEAQEAEGNGRAGLAIHGGRGNARLVPTGGCIRVLDKDFARLAAALGDHVAVRVRVRAEGQRP